MKEPLSEVPLSEQDRKAIAEFVTERWPNPDNHSMALGGFYGAEWGIQYTRRTMLGIDVAAAVDEELGCKATRIAELEADLLVTTNVRDSYLKRVKELEAEVARLKETINDAGILTGDDAIDFERNAREAERQAAERRALKSAIESEETKKGA